MSIIFNILIKTHNYDLDFYTLVKLPINYLSICHKCILVKFSSWICGQIPEGYKNILALNHSD